MTKPEFTGRPEDKVKKEHVAPGQQKVFTATRTLPDGTVEPKEFTNETWRQRDKNENWVRPDDDETADEDETDTAI